jgi:crossover junction endodeoxyribonuclease RuvC
MPKIYFIGLDPGSSSGAYGIIDHDGKYVTCGDIPTVDSRVDVRLLFSRINLFVESYYAVEDVHTMPKQGIASSGKFMRAAGAIEATAALTGAPMMLVTPQRWKKHHGLIGTEKKASLELARQRWPDAPLKLVKHHGRADALLMAQWIKDQVK